MLPPKRLQLLPEVVPNAARAGFLADPTYPANQYVLADLQAAARTLSLNLVLANARNDGDLETAFATFLQQRVGAVLVGDSTFYVERREQLAALAALHALPTIYPSPDFTLAGGLMSYGGYSDALHQVGIYTGRILKGEKPADLPIVQPTKFELVGRQSARPHHPGNTVGHGQ